MEKIKTIAVTFTLQESELVEIEKLADENGRTLEEQFEAMMTLGCKWDIQEKIKFWKKMRENEMKKKGFIKCSGCGEYTNDPMKGPPATAEDEAQDFSLYCPRCHEEGVEAHYAGNE